MSNSLAEIAKRQALEKLKKRYGHAKKAGPTTAN